MCYYQIFISFVSCYFQTTGALDMTFDLFILKNDYFLLTMQMIFKSYYFL